MHTADPAAFIAAERLAQPAKCPECNAPAILAIGRIHLGHYKANGEVREGLIWTCSDACFLSWEPSQLMAQA
jgi:hypothetical protein